MQKVKRATRHETTPRPRVPLPETIDLIGIERTIQVNHCRMPNCDNFGGPARHQHGKRGPSQDRDMHYKVHSTSKGTVPSVRCKSCKDNPPLRSNASIASEVQRMIGLNGFLRLEETEACRNADCANANRPIARYRTNYQKYGCAPNGGQYYRCKACGRVMLLSARTHLRKNYRRLASDVFGRIVNKAPMRRAVNGAGLKSPGAYYRILNFIHERCQAYSGAFDRAMLDGRLQLPRELNIEADAQVYQLNWISRLDRRNVELSAYCCVDSASRFVFGLHSNFDPGVDPFEINAQAAKQGDMQKPEAFREHAHYWLAGDELRAGRAMSRRVVERQDLINQLEMLYAEAASREDVENTELHHFNETYVTPELKGGLQVHMPYTAYAHWLLMHRILTGAGVKKVQANVDIDSMSRAAFLCAFADETKRGDAHLFYVRFTKYLTVDQRRRILEKSKRARRAFARSLPASVRNNRYEVARRMMLEAFKHSYRHGKWADEWIRHPLPTMNEPEKAVSWMTPDKSLDERQKADLFLRAGLARVDNIFQRTRRLINAFERPIGTSSSYNRVWHGYSPYNPALVQIYLTVFRTVQNFVWVSEVDGMTPAMRLGFVRKPLSLDDLLWPGQRIPRPKRSRRKGLALAV